MQGRDAEACPMVVWQREATLMQALGIFMQDAAGDENVLRFADGTDILTTACDHTRDQALGSEWSQTCTSLPLPMPGPSHSLSYHR